MTEIFEQLSTLSIEELQQVIAKSQQLIEEKEQMALRLAQLEKERLEKERLEKERKRQEEIAELQRRLRELQGEDSLISDEQPKAEETVPVTPVQPKVEENVQSVPVQPQETVYSMIPCPNCHQMIPSDSKFCHFCGTSMETQPVPPVQPVQQAQPAQPAYEASGSVVDYDSVRYMDESVKKWADLAGEGEMFSWRDIKMTSPEEAKKLACYIKITTQRILISSESLMKARARTTAFGAIGNLVVEEKGTPWIWIPLNAVRCYRMLDKKEMLIEADRIYTFHSSKAKDIYATLQQLIPDRAR